MILRANENLEAPLEGCGLTGTSGENRAEMTQVVKVGKAVDFAGRITHQAEPVASYGVSFMAAAYQAGQVRFCAVVTSEGSQQDDGIGFPRAGTKTRHGDGAQSRSH